MEYFQQPTSLIQQNSIASNTYLTLQSPKKNLLLYTIGGVLLLGAVAVAGIFLFKDRPSQLELGNQLLKTTAGNSCPLKAGRFIGRILSKENPFIAEILDYALESPRPTKDKLFLNLSYNHDFTEVERPLIIDSRANVTDNNEAKVGDIVLGQYSHGICGIPGGELGFCSYVNILEIAGNQTVYCNNEKNLQYVDRKNQVVFGLTDHDGRSLLTVRQNGDVHYVDYCPSSIRKCNT